MKRAGHVMKVQELIDALRIVGNQRIPIAVMDDTGKKDRLSWEFDNEGPFWEELTFHIASRGQRTLDTDAAKAIIDYVFLDPENRVPIFGTERQLPDYHLAVQRDCRNGPYITHVKNISVEKCDDKKEVIILLTGVLGNEERTWKKKLTGSSGATLQIESGSERDE